MSRVEEGEAAPGIEIVPVTPFAQNCAILFDRALMEGVVIDPGGDVDRITAAVARLGLTVAAIWLPAFCVNHFVIARPHEPGRALLSSGSRNSSATTQVTAPAVLRSRAPKASPNSAQPMT